MSQLPIGIFGGTFDPVHLGHIDLATAVYHLCDLQKVILMPCCQSPLRVVPNVDAKDRFNMVQLAIKGLPFLEVDDYEIQRPTVSYTSQTLEYLHKKYSGVPLVLIVGLDVFNSFDSWHEWRKILDFAHLVVVNRKNYQQILSDEMMKILSERQVLTPQALQKKTAGLIYLAGIEPLPIAATEIRELVKHRKDASHLVSKEVWQYINNNKLYTDQTNKIEENKNMQKYTAADIKKLIVATLKEHKAIDVLAINVKKLTDVSDYMVIATANSTVHAKTLIDKTCKHLRSLHIRSIGVEGDGAQEWMLADFGDVVVHVMLESARKFYELEKLWSITKSARVATEKKGEENQD